MNPSHTSHSWDKRMACLFLLLSILGLPSSMALLTNKCQIAEGWLKPHTAEPLSLCPSDLDTSLVVLCSNVTSLPDDLAPVPEQVNALCLSGSINILHEGAFLSFPELRYLSITLKTPVILPQAFLGLDKLQYLSIHHSNVGCAKSSIPTQVFQQLPQLQALDIKGIHLTGLRGIALASPLQSLSVSNCCMQNFSELLSIFPSLKSIPHVTVKNCKMESLPYSLSPRQHPNDPVLAVSASWLAKERVTPKAQNGSLLQTLSLSQFPLSFSELMIFEKLESLSLEEINLLHENQTCPICVLAAHFTLHSLTFSWNYYKNFVGEEFPACHSLKSLVLEGNKLEHVDSLLLYNLPHLQLLDLSDNHLHWDLCPAAYKTMNFISILQVLDFSGNNGTTLPASAFSCLPYLQELSLNRCGLNKIDPLAFSGFNNIKVLNLKKNSIKYLYLDSFSTLPFLTSLDLRDNDIEYFGRRVFENLTLLRYLQIGSYEVLPEVYFTVPNVTTFGLKTDFGTFFHSTVTTAFASVQNMSLSGCYIFQNTKNHSFFPSVQLLHWEPALHECMSSQPFHQHFPQLEQLIYKYQIEDTLFSSKTFNFSHLSRLQILEVHNLPEDIYSPKEVQYYFMDLPSLEVLRVVNSEIRYISAAFFHRKGNLRVLVLEKEDFLALDSDIQDQIEEHVHPRYLHFSNVTFRCDCSSAWLIGWATRKKGIYVSGLEQADCLDVIGRRNRQKFVPFIEQNCSLNVAFLLFTVTFSFLFFLISFPLLNATCGSDFIFLIYMLRVWWKGLLEHNKDRRFEYDAFVTYSSQDQGWVLEHLVPNLEQNRPPFLKLCLHNRDFVVGKAIVDNIMESLYSSRKTICVISHNALGSHWCSLELSLATYRLVAEQDDTLILLFMEPVPRHQLSAYHRLAKLVKRKTYLDWPKEPAARAAFWDKLRGILGQHKASGQEKM